MRFYRFKQENLLFLLSALLIALCLSTTARAQISINIGISSAEANRTLVDNGYSQIELYRKGFKTANARACKDGIRYDVKVDNKRRVKSAKKIGHCRNQVTQDQVRQNLVANGFDRVLIEEQNGYYVAIACRDGKRSRIIITRQGRIEQNRNIGRCQDALQPTDVAEQLRQRGYDRVFFTDRQLPNYVAEACLQNRKFELVLNRFGEIRSERRIGRCEPPLDPKNLVRFLQDKGYDRIDVINARLPRYRVEACLKEQRLDVSLNEYGQIIDREVIGRCNAPVSEEEIANILKEEGFSRININRNNRGVFDISACLQGAEKLIKLSRFGELISERDNGVCESRSVKEISDNLRGRGFDQLKFYSEGCRRGRLVRIYFNEFGDRVGRERLGNC